MMEKLVLVQKAISKVFGDFVAKVVSDGVDALKDAIKDADLDRKSYNQNLQTRLYQLIVDALNRFTYNKYEKQDKLYDAAESIIKGYIGSKDNTDAVKSGLKMLVSGVNDDTCQEFLEILCGEICRDDNSDLYKEFDMLWKKRESEYFRGEFTKIDQNDREIFEQLNNIEEVLDFIRRNMNRQEGDKLGHNGIPVVNRVDEYAKKWNENVFLNDFNEEDENAGVNIKLKDIYIDECLPHYIWGSNTKLSDKLRDCLIKYMNNDKKKMLLILGQPGIGKSTLITWIMANLVKKKENILIYQFSTDLNSIDWQSKNILEDICSVIRLEQDELENKTLILDGFDEIYIGNDRERILNKLNRELMSLNTLKTFSVIITCRENYIYNLQNIYCDYIVLQAWDEIQIEKFCITYWKKCGNAISKDKIQKILENKEIFGIPLILYMILALDIPIEKSSSIADVYDHVFSQKKGGIYDRCYDTEHRINEPKIKKYIHQISQRMSFWIFENNDEKAFIYQKNFKQICDNVMSQVEDKSNNMQSDTLIGCYFKIKHCEGKLADEVNFVHRSIYEYFVAIYFFETISNLSSKEEVAGKLGELLKTGHLSKLMLEFIKHKFENIKGYNWAEVTKKVFNKMLRNGMTYYVNEKYNNVIEKERNIFFNMLEIVGLWNLNLEKLNNRIIVYLQCNRFSKLNVKGIKLGDSNADMKNLIGAYLNGANLSRAYLYNVNLTGANLNRADLKSADLIGTFLIKADLGGADLGGAYLSGADLSGANLSEANLYRAHLVETNLSGAYLVGAYLGGVDLSEANLSQTIFDESQVNMLYKKCDLFNSRVYLAEKEEIISYVEYSISK